MAQLCNIWPFIKHGLEARKPRGLSWKVFNFKRDSLHVRILGPVEDLYRGVLGKYTLT